MKKILIVGSKNSGNKNNPEILARSVATDSTEVRLIYWEDIIFNIVTGKVELLVNNKNILNKGVDLCISLGWYKNGKQSFYRDMAYAFALILKSHSIPFWNSEMGMQRSTTKLSTMVQLALENISIPNSMFSIAYKSSFTFFDYPYITKAISASRGNNNYLITNSIERNKALNHNLPMIIQEYLENDHDIRVICFAGKPALILKRSRINMSEGHKNNTSQGARAEWLPVDSVDSRVLTICENICKITGREMAGIDLIPNNSSPMGYSCLEVNPIPQLTSGIDVDIKLTALANAIING